jgi:DNA gyrase subunit A
LTYDKAKFKKTGALIGAMVVNEDDEILLINSDGVIIRINAGDVSKLGRATQGVKIMKVGEDTNIIAMAKVIREDDEDDDANGAGGNDGEAPQIGEQPGGQLTLDTESE